MRPSNRQMNADRFTPVLTDCLACQSTRNRRSRSIVGTGSLLTQAILISLAVWIGQPLAFAQEFSRDDELRGPLTPARRCYDVKAYDLAVRIDPESRIVTGENVISFEVLEETERLQIDLFANMEIDRVMLDDTTEITFEREVNSVFLQLPESLEVDSTHTLQIEYHGSPIIASRPPWNGGFTWAEDAEGNPWVVVTSQGTGASLWWPHKDHPSDEPEEMDLRVTVPPGLVDISNGRLLETTEHADGWTEFHWKITYPINNYNVTINVGKYAHFEDTYIREDGSRLTLDYYVMPENLERAKPHFEQTKSMLEAFEKYFGRYPFERDGFKLIECPHTGMEHQSAIAYGNGYQGGYRGRASSEVGRLFDFIIIHEAAHEWWGNNVTMTDNADLWIHESFGAYAESLFVEHVYGYDQAVDYINGKRSNVRNRQPIVGKYGSNRSGAGDMYDKGQLVLHTLRNVIGDDETWFDILMTMQTRFQYQNVTAVEVFELIEEHAELDLQYFFQQYLFHPSLPKLHVQLKNHNNSLHVTYRWEADVEDFRMPIKILDAKGEWLDIQPTHQWQELTLEEMNADDFAVADQLYYFELIIDP